MALRMPKLIMENYVRISLGWARVQRRITAGLTASRLLYQTDVYTINFASLKTAVSDGQWLPELQ